MKHQQRQAAIEILADGFFDNPVMSWVFPDASTRAVALAAWFSFWLETYADRAVVVVSEGGEGAAIWAPPDTPPLSGPEIERFFGVITSFSGDHAGEVLARFATLSSPTDRHWYLNAIAARRGARARGIGASLLEPFLARSEREGTPIYLESSNPKNLSFYRRYGFEDHGPCVVLDAEDARLQPMWRA